MKESAGKKTARELFYYQCLSDWFSPDEIQTSDYLLLLGEEMHEIPYLNELGVGHDRIWSIENVFSVYQRQTENKNVQASLYYGSMNDYLERMLHSNQKFQVFNLDIEGTYLDKLDRAMTSVLLYAWKNPRTIIATYSTIGRDERMIWEGLLSFALFMCISPKKSKMVLAALLERYNDAGRKQGLHFALRDMFWIRSILEHTLEATALVDKTSLHSVEVFKHYEAKMWEQIRKDTKPPLAFGDLKSSIANMPSYSSLGSTPMTNLVPEKFCFFLYKAKHPWNHSGKASMFEVRSRKISVKTWIDHVFDLFLETPLVHINREGDEGYYFHKGTERVIKSDTVLWEDDRFWNQFKPRLLSTGNLKQVSSVVKSIEAVQSTTGDRDMGQECATILFDTNNKITEFGGDVVKRLGAGKRLPSDMYTALSVATPNGAIKKYVVQNGRQRQLNCEAIQKLLPGDVPIKNIAAHVAFARRKGWSPN